MRRGGAILNGSYIEWSKFRFYQRLTFVEVRVGKLVHVQYMAREHGASTCLRTLFEAFKGRSAYRWCLGATRVCVMCVNMYTLHIHILYDIKCKYIHI